MWNGTIDYTNYPVFVLGVDLLRDLFKNSNLETDYWYDFCFELEKEIAEYDRENGGFDQSYYQTMEDYVCAHEKEIKEKLNEYYSGNDFWFL